jgi:hypothetical protein
LRAYGVHHARDVIAQSPAPVCVVAIRHRPLANTSPLLSVLSLAPPPWRVRAWRSQSQFPTN